MILTGKLTVCYGKSASLKGKSTINGPFSIISYVTNYQRVTWFNSIPSKKQKRWIFHILLVENDNK
jgi:hypothetical protein